MKHIAALILLLFSTNSFSQTPNPDLFRTWYLYDIYSSDDNIHHPVSAVTPYTSPYITFTETLDFTGRGSCNYFTGTFEYSAGNFLRFNNFSSTLSLCSSSSHTSLEGTFFSLLHTGGQYVISGTGDNMRLVISTPIFANYVFGVSQLSVTDFDLKQTTLYPNPADSELFVDPKDNVIDKIEIFNSVGQTVKIVNTDFNIISLSDFASGIYFIKLYSENKTVIKKFVKK